MESRTPLSVLYLHGADKEQFEVVVMIYGEGHGDLDLALCASQGVDAWTATIQQSNVARLKAKGNHSSDEIWSEVLKSGLVVGTPNQIHAGELLGLEIIPTVGKDGALSLVFRRNVGELTQRLGTIEFKSPNEGGFEAWDGCWGSAMLCVQERQRANKLQGKLTAQLEHNQRLQKQLKELIQAKEEHENALLQKFTEVLNAKKLKIRDQQRLLATAKIDPKRVAELEAEEQEAQPTRKTAGSRGAKRKAAAKTADSDDASSGGFESVKEESDVETEAATPEPLEDPGDTTEDDNDDDEAPAIPRIAKTIGNRTKDSKPTGRQSKSAKVTLEQARAKQPASAKKSKASTTEMPPRRELPFQRRKAAQEADQKLSPEVPATSAPTAEQSSGPAIDDDSTDDEL